MNKLILILMLALSPALIYAWSGPTDVPPRANKEAPLNVNPQSQEKLGGLSVGALLPRANPIGECVYDRAGNCVRTVPHYGVTTPSRLIGGALCFLEPTGPDCRYHWSEISGGGGGGGSCTISGSTITCSGSTFENFWERASGYIRNIGGGLVKIGETTPKSDSIKLEVPGGPISASGGFILETRSNNPSTLTPGRMWLCTGSSPATTCPTD